ncbi:neuronal acetylcholine receptor subunit beta-4-like [Saccoglossus kowalevskii]|uniref:Neuronal acetylcholine receptor subunit beta-4-like n=1 Tax=Saccoglossus kowalevskii TaxID=10224 RepID=A0ABM0H1S2_SACKO|nr:PREDICTED: neuronal acetylcholine receptor subunit beta-4-like [Saccoglossus kowalevskii]
MDITYFPVDQQTCNFEFGQWAYLDSQVILRAGKENATLENYLPNVEWDIVDSNATAIAKHFQGVDDSFTTIVISMDIKRKPLYYTVNLILPCVVVSLLTIVVFCLPSMSSDKVSLSISLLLTIYVFNILVIDLLPATSLELPLLTVYLIFSMGLIGLSVALTTLVSRIYSKGEHAKAVPQFLRTIFLGKLAGFLFVKVKLTPVSKAADAAAYKALNSDEIAISDAVYYCSNPRNRVDGEQYEMNNWTRLESKGNSKACAGGCLTGKRPKFPANSLKKNKKKKAVKVFFICERTNQRILSNLDKLVRHTETLIRHIVPNKKTKQNHDEWVALATVVDRILLVLFIIVGCGMFMLLLAVVEVMLFSVGTGVCDETSRFMSNEESLMKYLINDAYSPLSRPVRNSSDVVEVNLWMTLTQLMDVNEKSQLITTNVWIYQSWNDPRLAWNDTDFNGISAIRLPVQNVWTPDTSLLTSADNQYPGFPLMHIKELNAIVYSNGDVLKIVPQVLYTPCIMDIKMFPVDIQHCELEFQSWSFSSNEMILISHYDEVKFEKYIPNVEWDVTSSSVTPVRRTFAEVNGLHSYTSLIATLVIERKPLYYVINLILPCVMVSVLTLVVFCLPSNSPDKLNLSISLMLTLYVFNLLITDLLPPTSTNLPLITVYFLFSMFAIAISVAVTTLVSKIYKKCEVSGEQRPVPKWVKKLLLGKMYEYLLLPKRHYLKKKGNSIILHNYTPELAGQDNIPHNIFSDILGRKIKYERAIPSVKYRKLKLCFSNNRQNGKIISALRKITKSLDKITRYMLPDIHSDKIRTEWMEVAAVVDRILLIMFSVCIITGALIILPRIT